MEMHMAKFKFNTLGKEYNYIMGQIMYKCIVAKSEL